MSTIYNKYKELSTNSWKFINTLPNKQEILRYFEGKTRFEVKLDSERKILEHICANSIYEFFDSIDTVNRTQFDKIFDVSAKPLDTSKCKKGWDEWSVAHILDYYHYDLKRIDQAMRADGVFLSRNGHSNRMKLCEEVKAKVSRKENEIIRQVRSLL